LAFVAPDGRILKANFQKFSGDRLIPGPRLREGATPFRTHHQYNILLCAGLKRPIAGTQTIVPMVPNVCPSKNNLLAPPLLGAISPWPLYFYLPSFFSTLHYRPSPLFSVPSHSFGGKPFNPLHFLSLSLSIHGSEDFSPGENFSYLDGCR